MALGEIQDSLKGANAGTSTPQTMVAPQQLNPNAMNNQVQKAQIMGIPTAQAVNKASSNPNNRYYAKGGDVAPPTVDKMHLTDASQDVIDRWADAVASTPALKEDKTSSKPQNTPSGDAEFKQYDNKMGQDYLKDRSKMAPAPKNYAKGGSVDENPKDMSLKDIVKMLATHPDVMNQSRMAASSPMKGTDMAKGGMATANTQGKSEARSHAKGLMAMNDDVGSYNEGGEVLGNDPDPDVASQVSTNTGLLKMAVGGGLQGDTEEGNITGYDPDGTPIIQNADGTQQEGNINDFLGRPSNANTLGTGTTPVNGVSKNASNAIGGDTANNMAKGGEESGNNPPPGSMKAEVADNIPARLSGGEFVFSADVVRFYGLRTLNMMMEHARNALTEMNDEGTIRHPGDGKDKPSNEEGGGQFLQDAEPNKNAYKNNDMDGGEEDEEGAKKISGLLAECAGGYNMAAGGNIGQIKPQEPNSDMDNDKELNALQKAHEDKLIKEGRGHGELIQWDLNHSNDGNPVSLATGGGIGEEQSLAKGGSVYHKDEYPIGRDNMVSAHPKGGAVAQDYKSGGVVTASSSNMFPKKSESLIPTGEAKIPGLKKSFAKVKELPKMAKGGLIDYNNAINKETNQSYIGS